MARETEDEDSEEDLCRGEGISVDLGFGFGVGDWEAVAEGVEVRTSRPRRARLGIDDMEGGN